MIFYHVEIQTPKLDEDLKRLLDELKQYCDEHGYGHAYSMTNEATGKIIAIPNLHYQTRKHLE